jgi:hypothetical protein
MQGGTGEHGSWGAREHGSWGEWERRSEVRRITSWVKPLRMMESTKVDFVTVACDFSRWRMQSSEGVREQGSEGAGESESRRVAKREQLLSD